MTDTFSPADVQVLRRERRLPIPGDVLVRPGDVVNHDTVIARAEVQGAPVGISMAAKLDVLPSEMGKFMLKRVGDQVEKAEPLAMYSGMFGLGKKVIYSPTAGTVESISAKTGIVVIREPSIPIDVKSYIRGRVVGIVEQEGAEVESSAIVLYGKFGIGRERWGELKLVSTNREQIVTPDLLTGDLSGKILVGGSMVTVDALRKAVHAGASGFIVGGMDNDDLTSFAGHDLGVPITGQEEVALSLIVTDGFGRTPMTEASFSLLSSFEGQQVSINGTTHLRANLIKPEIILFV